jgi:hypothetical protein
MPSNCCHFNNYGHNYDYMIINMITNMTIGDHDYNYDYK